MLDAYAADPVKLRKSPSGIWRGVTAGSFFPLTGWARLVAASLTVIAAVAGRERPGRSNPRQAKRSTSYPAKPSDPGKRPKPRGPHKAARQPPTVRHGPASRCDRHSPVALPGIPAFAARIGEGTRGGDESGRGGRRGLAPSLASRPLGNRWPGGGECPGDVGRADGHHDDYPDVIAAPAGWRLSSNGRRWGDRFGVAT